MLTRVISGGQTGVDQAALRVARSLGIAIGGWCPPGRISADGVIPSDFPLTETPDDRSPDAPDIPRSQRTEWNVRDSDGTLVLCLGPLAAADPGTRFTAEYATRSSKPLFVADPADFSDARRVREWINIHSIANPERRRPQRAECFRHQ